MQENQNSAAASRVRQLNAIARNFEAANTAAADLLTSVRGFARNMNDIRRGIRVWTSFFENSSGGGGDVDESTASTQLSMSFASSSADTSLNMSLETSLDLSEDRDNLY